MSHPNLLEDHLLSSCPLVDGSPSVVRAFTDHFRAPHGMGITPKSFYSRFIQPGLDLLRLRSLKSF
ncbi:MAG: hypothetical protein ACRC8K_06700 [Waterburya sp.]